MNAALPTGCLNKNISKRNPISSPISGITPTLCLTTCFTDCSSASPPNLNNNLESPFLVANFAALSFASFAAALANVLCLFAAFCANLSALFIFLGNFFLFLSNAALILCSSDDSGFFLLGFFIPSSSSDILAKSGSSKAPASLGSSSKPEKSTSTPVGKSVIIFLFLTVSLKVSSAMNFLRAFSSASTSAGVTFPILDASCISFIPLAILRFI